MLCFVLFICLMEFNYIFNNISVISWRSVLFVEAAVLSRRNNHLSQVTDKLYHIILYTSPWSRFDITTSVVIGTDCIDNCKSNYHAVMATTAPSMSSDNMLILDSDAWSLVFYVVFCSSLFVPLTFFFWPLYCLSFELWLLIALLVFSIFSLLCPS
jgi:hypothetical protein